EIVVRTRSAGSWWTSGWLHGRVWSASVASGKPRIVRYAAAKTIDVQDVRDVDGDGRPDLLTYAPFVGAAPDARVSGKDAWVHGPLLVARSLPDGSFALDGPASISAARAACPKAPTSPWIVLGPDGEANEEKSTANVVCARFWGVTTAAL